MPTPMKSARKQTGRVNPRIYPMIIRIPVGDAEKHEVTFEFRPNSDYLVSVRIVLEDDFVRIELLQFAKERFRKRVGMKIDFHTSIPLLRGSIDRSACWCQGEERYYG